MKLSDWSTEVFSLVPEDTVIKILFYTFIAFHLFQGVVFITLFHNVLSCNKSILVHFRPVYLLNHHMYYLT